MQGWHYGKGLIYYGFSFLTSEYVDPVLYYFTFFRP